MNKSLKNGMDTALALWTEYCAQAPQGERQNLSADGYAAKSKRAGSLWRVGMQFFRYLDLVSLEAEYHLRQQISHYTRLVDEDAGVKRIRAHFEAGRGFHHFTKPENRPGYTPKEVKAEAVVVATRPTEETRAIAGPEPESPMAPLAPVKRELAEPEALLEAARQYANRTDAVSRKMDELEALGLTIDRDQFIKSIKLDHDPVLDAAASLLPMFDRTQRVIDRLTTESQNLRAEVTNLRRENGELVKRNASLEAANGRLSERNIQLSGQLAEQRVVTHA